MVPYPRYYCHDEIIHHRRHNAIPSYPVRILDQRLSLRRFWLVCSDILPDDMLLGFGALTNDNDLCGFVDQLTDGESPVLSCLIAALGLY